MLSGSITAKVNQDSADLPRRFPQRSEGRRHAYSSPHENGSIGVWGYDFSNGVLVRPSTPDVMSYCGPPDWISGYHFTNALRFRLSEADQAGLPDAPPTRSLLVWGGRDSEGVPYLEPSFVVEAPLALPDSPSEYTVAGQAADGGELFALSFAMPETADGDGSAGFVFALPVRPGWEDTLAAITLSGPGGSVTLDGDTDLPMAILRDPASGRVRGIHRDLPPARQAAMDTAGQAIEPGLEVLFSRGIPDAMAWRR